MFDMAMLHSPPALQSESCLQLAEERGQEKGQNIPTPEL